MSATKPLLKRWKTQPDEFEFIQIHFICKTIYSAVTRNKHVEPQLEFEGIVDFDLENCFIYAYPSSDYASIWWLNEMSQHSLPPSPD